MPQKAGNLSKVHKLSLHKFLESNQFYVPLLTPCRYIKPLLTPLSFSYFLHSQKNYTWALWATLGFQLHHLLLRCARWASYIPSLGLGCLTCKWGEVS